MSAAPAGTASAQRGAEDLVAFAQRLVRTPSPSGAERAVSELLADELEALGYRDVEVDEHGNVVARYGPDPPRLLFNGHLDHVDPAGMEEPFEGALVDGAAWGESGQALRGRGSCDMKANVAAGAYAVAFLDGAELAAGYVFAADVREEPDAYEGMPLLLDRGLHAEFGLSGESTGLDVALGHRGKLVFEVRVHGRSSHASRPSAGVNAVYAAQPLIAAIERENEALESDPDFGPATIVVTEIASEPADGSAVVPAACTFRVDRRYLPAERPEAVEARLRGLIGATAAEHGIAASVAPINHYPLMAIDREHPLVAAGVEAVRSSGREGAVTTWDFGVNATFMSAAGIPSIGIGPGNERFAHTPDEHVPVDELVDASRIYADLIRRLCS